MEEAHLQGNSPFLAQVECLQLPVSGPVPHVEAGAVQTWKQSQRTLADLQKTPTHFGPTRLDLQDLISLETHRLRRGPGRSRQPGL